MEEDRNTNWTQAVGCVVTRNQGREVLLGRQTYGVGKGKLIMPGGYAKFGELPAQTAVREVLEETGVMVNPGRVLGIRCDTKNWYIMMEAEYISGDAHAADEENSEVIWLDSEEALTRVDVPDLTKEAISSMLYRKENAWMDMAYENKTQKSQNKQYQYFGIKR